MPPIVRGGTRLPIRHTLAFMPMSPWTVAVLRVLLCVLPIAVAAAPRAGDGAPPGTPLVQERVLTLEDLRADSPRVRREAALRLGEIGTADDADALVVALRDADAAVRAAAERALWAVWSRSGDPEIDAALAHGTSLMAKGALDESIAVFSDIVARRPDFAEGTNKRATGRFLKGDYAASLADCDEVVRRNPRHFGALAGYGQIHIRLGNLETAEHFFEQALEINPNMAGVAAALTATRDELARRGRQRT